MRAGDLRYLITFQERTITEDGRGGYTKTWADSFDAWAKVEAPRGLEKIEAAKLTGKRTYKIIVYYDSRINNQLRIKYTPESTALYLTISDARDPNGRRRYMEITAHEDID